MTYNVTTVADSINPKGIRLTTFEITMPKWLVAELNTHRNRVARNSASSRAIPTQKIITQVMENPVIPLDFRHNIPGMQAGGTLPPTEHEKAKRAWLRPRRHAVQAAKDLLELGADKQRINRLLEPWMWTVVVFTINDSQNFFTLRNSPQAQPEFGYLARWMQHELDTRDPQQLLAGQWHLPYVTDEHRQDVARITYDESVQGILLAKVSSAYCGTVSYLRHTVDRTVGEALKRADDFANMSHWSTLEHSCMSMDDCDWYGPFCGFKQLRKFYDNESGEPNGK